MLKSLLASCNFPHWTISAVYIVLHGCKVKVILIWGCLGGGSVFVFLIVGVFCFVFETASHCVIEAGFESMTLLPWLPEWALSTDMTEPLCTEHRQGSEPLCTEHRHETDALSTDMTQSHYAHLEFCFWGRRLAYCTYCNYHSRTLRYSSLLSS